MLPGNLLTLKNYVQNLVETKTAAKYFIYCDAVTLIGKSRSGEGFKYPFLNMSRPNIQPENNGFGNQTTVFYCEFTCMDKINLAGKKTAEHDDEVLRAENDTANILLELERLLRVAHTKGDIEVTFKNEIDPVPPKWIDLHTGWKLTCSITLGPNSTACR
jgi:hypothetical protein